MAYSSVFTACLSGQNIQLISAQGIEISGSDILAEKKLTLQAAGILPKAGEQTQSAIFIDGVADSYEIGLERFKSHYDKAIINKPSRLQGKQGISIEAPAANENARIIIGASQLNAPNGCIDIKAYGDVLLESGENDAYTFLKTKSRSGGIVRKSKFTSNTNHLIMPAPTELNSSVGIGIQSGGDIDAYSTRFNAPKGKITLTAAEELNLLAVEGQHLHKRETTKSTRFIGIKIKNKDYKREELTETKLPVKMIAKGVNTRSGWDTVLEGTEFETGLAGADIQTGVGPKARADAQIIFKGIVTRVNTEEHSKSNSTVWQSMAGSGSTIDSLSLPKFEGPTPPKFSAPGGYIVDIPKGQLKTEIEKLAKQPQYAYLKQLQLAKDINWNHVQLEYQKWDYKQEGLTGAGAAIIALALAAVTGGAGAGLATALSSTAVTGASAAMANAAFLSLATQASVSLINNKGNVGKTFKDLGRSSTVKNLATAVVTAGVAKQLNIAAGLDGVDSNSPFMDKLSNNLIDAGSAAAVGTAINGGSLSDSLESVILAALVQTAHGAAASKIKDLDSYYIAHKVAHAVAGCAAAAANKGKCQDGAIGAAVGEIVGEALVKNTDFSGMTASEIEKTKAQITAYAKLAAGTTVGITGGNVDVASNAAETSVKNNALDIIGDIGNLIWDGGKWIYAKSIGDKQMAREAAIDFGVDAAAAAIPFAPAGVTKLSRGGAYVLKAGDEAVDSAKAVQEIYKQTGIKLTYDKVNKVWTTPAGLDYGLHRKDGNRIKHVLKHTVPDPNKRLHTVFSVSRKEVLPLIDDAWKKKGAPLPNDPAAYVVDMGRVIGTNGETKIRIAIEAKGSNRIASAYPQK